MSKKTRAGAVKLNFVTGFLHELIIIVFGLLVPRITLSYFGSAYNGLLNSVTQFLAFSVVLRSGLGVVTNAALFKPKVIIATVIFEMLGEVRMT